MFEMLGSDGCTFHEADFTYADPRVLQCLAGGDPFARVHRQHLIDQVLGFRRDGVPFWAWILPKTNEQNNSLNADKDDKFYGDPCTVFRSYFPFL